MAKAEMSELVINGLKIRLDVVEEIPLSLLLPTCWHEMVASIETKLGFSVKICLVSLLTLKEMIRRGLNRQEIDLIGRVLAVIKPGACGSDSSEWKFFLADQLVGWMETDEEAIKTRLLQIVSIWIKFDTNSRREARADLLVNKVILALDKPEAEYLLPAVPVVVSTGGHPVPKVAKAPKAVAQPVPKVEPIPWQLAAVKVLKSQEQGADSLKIFEVFLAVAKDFPLESISTYSAESLALLVSERLDMSLRTYYRRLVVSEPLKRAHDILAPGAAERLRQAIEISERSEKAKPATHVELLALARTDGAQLFRRRSDGQYYQPDMVKRARALVKQGLREASLRENPHDTKLKREIAKRLTWPISKPSSVFAQVTIAKKLSIDHGTLSGRQRKNKEVADMLANLKCLRAMAYCRERGLGSSESTLAMFAYMPVTELKGRLAANAHLAKAFSEL